MRGPKLRFLYHDTCRTLSFCRWLTVFSVFTGWSTGTSYSWVHPPPTHPTPTTPQPPPPTPPPPPPPPHTHTPTPFPVPNKPYGFCGLKSPSKLKRKSKMESMQKCCGACEQLKRAYGLCCVRAWTRTRPDPVRTEVDIYIISCRDSEVEKFAARGQVQVVLAEKPNEY